MSDLLSPDFVGTVDAEVVGTPTVEPKQKMFSYDGFVFALPIDPVTNVVTIDTLVTFLLQAIASPDIHAFLRAATLAVIDAQGKQFFPRVETPK
jgi:hypothetical protein